MRDCANHAICSYHYFLPDKDAAAPVDKSKFVYGRALFYSDLRRTPYYDAWLDQNPFSDKAQLPT